MSASLIHFALIHPGTAAHPAHPRVLHVNIDGASATSAPPADSTVHLLVLDARRMNPGCLRAAFAEIQRQRTFPGFKHGVLVCDVPALPLVQGAIRAGLRDIIHEPLTARQLVHLLRAATPGHRARSRQIAAFGALVRTLAAADTSASPSANLARREYALSQRADQLAHMETRLTLDRAALEDREQKLRAGTRRLERDFAALQKDADIAAPADVAIPANPTATPFTASPFPSASFVTDLQAIAAQLDRRARDLDLREKLLLEMEALLSGASLEPVRATA